MRGQINGNRSRNNGRGADKKRQTYRIASMLCGVLFFVCLVWLAAYFIGLKRAEDEMDAIFASYVSVGGAQDMNGQQKESADIENVENASNGASDEDNMVTEPDRTEENQEDLSAYGVTDRRIDWISLQEEVNKDIYGWIVVPGTVIDYPVLQHPEKTDYYLEHNLDGTKGRPGCIYSQRMNSKEWSDRNTVLYGHNMRVGTMFAGLHEFEDKAFFEENRYIHIYSEDGRILVYEIFAAYAFSDAHILMSYDFYTKDGYERYLDTVRESAEKDGHYMQEAAPSAEDKIITLSTCIRGKNSKRYLVQGVLTAEGKQP